MRGEPEEYYLDLPRLEGIEEGASVVLMVRGQSLGDAASEVGSDLGARLLAMFLTSLCEMPPVVKAIVLVNEAVRLAAAESAVLSAMETIEKQGTDILCCSTSCNFYKIEPLVGVRSSMFHIAETLLTAGKVITL